MLHAWDSSEVNHTLLSLQPLSMQTCSGKSTPLTQRQMARKEPREKGEFLMSNASGRRDGSGGFGTAGRHGIRSCLRGGGEGGHFGREASC